MSRLRIVENGIEKRYIVQGWQDAVERVAELVTDDTDSFSYPMKDGDIAAREAENDRLHDRIDNLEASLAEEQAVNLALEKREDELRYARDEAIRLLGKAELENVTLKRRVQDLEDRSLVQVARDWIVRMVMR